MAGKIIDATLRFVDKFTSPMNAAVAKMERSSKQYKRMGKEIKNAGKSISTVGSTMTKGVTLPIVGLGVGAVKTAADFESAMSKVQSISGATQGDMGKLSKKAQEMGGKTKFSAKESADAFSYMAMAGWKTKDMLNGIEGTMYLAGATGEDLASTADIVTDNLTAFGLSAKDTNRFVDQLAATANNSNTNVSMLGESFKYCAPSAGALKFNVKDTAVALGLMANSGIKASQAGTSLNSLFTRMAKPTKESGTAMKKLGISLTDSHGKMKSFDSIMKTMRKSFSGLTESQKAQYAAMLAGKTGMSGLLAVVNSSDKDFNKLSKAIGNSNGAAKKMYNVANNNLNGRLTVLKSTIESIAISFGKKLLPYVEKGVAKIQDLANKFNNLSPAMQDKIIKFGLLAAAAGPTILIFGKMVSSVGSVISIVGGLGGTLGKGAKAFNKFAGGGKIFSKIGVAGKAALGMIMTPAGAVVAGLAAIVVGGILVYKNWKKIKQFASGFGNKIKAVFKQCGGNAKAFGKTFSSVKKNISKIISNMKIIFSKIIEFLKPVVSFAKGVFLTGLGTAFRTVASIATGLGTSISQIVGGITKSLGGITDFVAGVFTGNWKKAWGGVKNIFGGVFDSLVGLVKTPFNAIIGLINGAISSINKISVKIPKGVPKFGGTTLGFNIGKIPYLYKGTSNWQGGLAVTQDRGAEIMDLPKGTRVYPHAKSLQMAKEEGAKSVKGKNVTINISKLADKVIVRSDQDIDKIAYELGKKLLEFIENGGGSEFA